MTAATNNFSQAELDKFDALAQRWWDANGPQKALHALNPVRLDYVAQRVPLMGVAALDVGCGGDLLKVARLHGLESGIKVGYRQVAVEVLADELPAGFDVITCMEMLEHVPDPGAIVEACARLLKPGGCLFLSTLNRTPAAFVLAIAGAEYVARLLPKGTHLYRDFIKPAELARMLRDAGLELEDISGLLYEPWRNGARLSKRTEVNYLACARKPE
ncbi:MAG TPA: bifunctional 2-polyprenyl-6-hydroxyphenol methylase/3-demethylubiquinol 3-O-methyltransferase UbiG [Thermomonas sp.]|nr:bifunctional 2-polyprenyl-6-hydroxyphenol methylase/3-demethylubiquinol 3-O-methyltransferase UbiG [Thermomonas sp.]